jgi:hypothetical protein
MPPGHPSVSRLAAGTVEDVTSAPEPVLLFCEPVHATGMREHIREADPDGTRYPNGGIPDTSPALCSLDLRRGWDLPGDVTPDVVRDKLSKNSTAQPGGPTICTGCANEYLNRPGH